MKRNKTILPLLFLTVAGSLSTIAGAQSAAQAPTQDMVYVTATVTGPKKAPVPGLKAENFQLTEDGVLQKITAFSDPDGPWDINLVFGHSQLKPGSTDDVSRGIRSAVETFQNTSHPKSRIHVEELKFGSDGLFATINRNLDDLQKSTTPRRALVVITDGFDRPYDSGNGTVDDLTDHIATDAPGKLVERSRKLNIPIYFLFCPINTAPLEVSDNVVRRAVPTATSLSNTELSDKDVLTTVAEQTGGAFVIGDPVHQLEVQIKLLAEELRNKYVLGFVSTNDKRDDKWRVLKLKVTPPAGQKVEVSMKKKYFVAKPPK